MAGEGAASGVFQGPKPYSERVKNVLDRADNARAPPGGGGRGRGHRPPIRSSLSTG